jgi:hypothetical protein
MKRREVKEGGKKKERNLLKDDLKCSHNI